MPYTLPVVKVRLKQNWETLPWASRVFARFPCSTTRQTVALRKLVFRTILDPVACRFAGYDRITSPMSMFLLLGSDQPDQAAVDVAYDSVASFGFGVGAPNHPPIREYVSSFGWPLNPYTEADQINYARSDFIREEMARSLSLEFPEPHPSRFKIHYLHIALFEPVNIRQPKYALVSEESLNSTTTRFIYRSHALARRP